jgi:hypothetical protein
MRRERQGFTSTAGTAANGQIMSRCQCCCGLQSNLGAEAPDVGRFVSGSLLNISIIPAVVWRRRTNRHRDRRELLFPCAEAAATKDHTALAGSCPQPHPCDQIGVEPPSCTTLNSRAVLAACNTRLWPQAFQRFGRPESAFSNSGECPRCYVMAATRRIDLIAGDCRAIHGLDEVPNGRK